MRFFRDWGDTGQFIGHKGRYVGARSGEEAHGETTDRVDQVEKMDGMDNVDKMDRMDRRRVVHRACGAMC